MNKKVKLGLLFFIIVIFISNSVYALSFGTYVKSNELNLDKGGEGRFEIFFYSRDKTPTKFSLYLIEYPENFIINYPKTFDSNSYYDNEYILIRGEYVKASVVNIDVKVPENVNNGSYDILLKAVAIGQTEKQQNALGVNAEKTFGLVVNIPGLNTSSLVNIQSEKTIQSSEDSRNKEFEQKTEETKVVVVSEQEPLTGLFTLISKNSVSWILSILVIIIISYFAYKKSFNSRKDEIYA